MSIFLLFSVLAQTQQLTIHDAVRTALANHPAVAVAEARMQRSDYFTAELRAALWPQLNLESSVNRFQEPMVVAPLHGFDPARPPVFDRTLAQGSVALNYTVLDMGRGDRITRAARLTEAAGEDVSAARAQVIAETVRAYLRVRSAAEQSDAHDKQVSALLRERARAAQLVEQGRAARVVLLRADAALSAARADAVTAQSELDDAYHELGRLLSQPASALRALQLTGVRVRDGTDTARSALLVVAERANPELRALRLQRAAAEAERSAARGNWWPRVQAVGRFVEYASGSTSPQGEWQAGAQLSYPLFTGGGRSAVIDRAGAEVRAADAQLALGERRMAEALDRALTALTAAQARVIALRAAVTQSEEVTRIDRLALDAGAGVQSDYLTAEANLFRARAALTEARAREVLARVELARVTGELSVEWVVAHLENVS